MNDSKQVTEAVLVDRQQVMEFYHREYCEYDGSEDGDAVCAGECREFVEALTPVSAEEGFALFRPRCPDCGGESNCVCFHCADLTGLPAQAVWP